MQLKLVVLAGARVPSYRRFMMPLPPGRNRRANARTRPANSAYGVFLVFGFPGCEFVEAVFAREQLQTEAMFFFGDARARILLDDHRLVEDWSSFLCP